MKHIKLFENFKDIERVNRVLMHQICKKYWINNYTINSDGTVDVDGNVNFYSKGLGKLPLKFGKVTGEFYCDENQLTSLEGCPSYVGGNFNCSFNRLISLEGGPKEVGRDFRCSSNQLVSLDGGPTEVDGVFYCDENPIWNIYDLFGDYKEYQASLDYNYLRGKNIVKLRLEEALEEIGKKLSNLDNTTIRIAGYNYI
mgnify:CR=1 FL=1